MINHFIDFDRDHIKDSLDSIRDELNTSLNSQDIRNICKIVILYNLISNELEGFNHLNENFKNYLNRAKLAICDWKSNLKEGSYVDIFDENYNQWFEAKIKSISSNEVGVHFIGWDSKEDKIIDLNKQLIIPQNIFTNKRIKGPKLDVKNTTEISDTQNHINDDTDSSVIVTTHSGRRVKSTRNSEGMMIKKQSTTETKKKREKAFAGREYGTDNNEFLCAICGMLNGTGDLILCDGPCLRSYHAGCVDEKTRQQVETEPIWYCDDCNDGHHRCFICDKYGYDFIEVCKCSVPSCGKYYHAECLLNCTYTVKPTIKFVQDTKPFKSNGVSNEVVDEVITTMKIGKGKKRKVVAEESTNSNNPIELSTNGHNTSQPTYSKKRSDKSNDDVNGKTTHAESNAIKSIRDSVGTTGPNSNGVAHTVKGTERLNDSMSNEILDVLSNNKVSKKSSKKAFIFKCPYHSCHTCSEFYPHDKAALIKCTYCPRSYHSNCIPPGTRFNLICLVCSRHPERQLPSEEAESVENLNDTFWYQMIVSEIIPDPQNVNDNHFRLPSKFRHDIKLEPRGYKHTSKLMYEKEYFNDKVIPYHSAEEECDCKDFCGKNCYNRQSRIECNDSICSLGKQCGNRRLQQMDYIKAEVFPEFEMGWGLRATEFAPKDSLIIEYVGEVIDDVEMKKRMWNQRQNTPSDKDYYIMLIENQFYVDGKHYGNNSRFINHSCDPNCELQLWQVNGRMRIAIVAIRDIQAGEPLSYDYHFDTNEEDIFKCYCKTSLCRGTMAPKKKQITNLNIHNLNEKEKKELIRNSKKNVEDIVEEEWSRSLTNKHLPGDPLNEIKNGPLRSSFLAARSNNIFLPRNMKLTQDFVLRKKRYFKLHNV